MYKFVNAVHSTIPSIKYGYLLEISDFNEFIDFHEKFQMPILNKSFNHVFEVLNKNPNTPHCNPTDSIAQCLIQLMKSNDKSLVYTFADLTNDIWKGQIECLEKGKIYFQKNGSYMSGGCIKILDEIGSKNLVWPSKKILSEKDIKISKWPGGKHYYIVVDEVQLEKQNTIEEAELLAKNYIKEHNDKN